MHLSVGEIIGALVALGLASSGMLIAWGSRATKIAHLEEAVKRIKEDCETLRGDCQTKTCQKLEELHGSVMENRELVVTALKENGEKFERIAEFMGEVRTYIRLKNGGVLSGKAD